MLPQLNAKKDALTHLIKTNEVAEVRVSEKTVRFWEMKRQASDGILDVLQHGETPSDALDSETQAKRAEYFKAAKAAWANLGNVLLQLHKEIIGPYVLGTSDMLLVSCVSV